MIEGGILGGVIHALADDGFTPVLTQNGVTFRGSVLVNGTAIRLRMEYRDLEFSEPAYVFVENPEDLPRPVLPHLDEKNELCVVDRRQFVADRYQAPAQAPGIVLRAREVIEKGLTHHATHEIANEFPQHWGGPAVGVEFGSYEGPTTRPAAPQNGKAGLGKHQRDKAYQPKRQQPLSGVQAGVVPTHGIILPHRILAKMQAERAVNLPKETGGFLIGASRGPHIEITDATLQGADDIATAFSFERADKRHESAIGAAWQEGSQQISVVGDWHSHPFGDGSPSGMDRRAWRTLSDANGMDCVGLILAGALLPRVFLLRRRAFHPKIMECALLADEGDDLVFGPSSRRAHRLI